MLVMVLRLLSLWQKGEGAEALRRLSHVGEEDPDLSLYLSAVGGQAWSTVLAGRPDDASALLDRVEAFELESLVVDAEWLGNLVNIVRAAAAVEHPVLGATVALLEPYAELVAFEGIGAGLYGSVATFARRGLPGPGTPRRRRPAGPDGRRGEPPLRGLLLADAEQVLSRCLAAGDGPVEAGPPGRSAAAQPVPPGGRGVAPHLRRAHDHS